MGTIAVLLDLKRQSLVIELGTERLELGVAILRGYVDILDRSPLTDLLAVGADRAPTATPRRNRKPAEQYQPGIFAGDTDAKPADVLAGEQNSNAALPE